MPSQKCQACNNQTLDPSGRCYLHQGASPTVQTSAIPSIPPPAIPKEWAEAYAFSQWDAARVREVAETMDIYMALPGVDTKLAGYAKAPAGMVAFTEEEAPQLVEWSDYSYPEMEGEGFLDIQHDLDYEEDGSPKADGLLYGLPKGTATNDGDGRIKMIHDGTHTKAYRVWKSGQEM